MKMLSIKKWSKSRDEWLQNVSRGQVLQQLTNLYTNGNFDMGPVFTQAELAQFHRSVDFPSRGATDALSQEDIANLFLHGSNFTDSPAKAASELLYKILIYHAAYPFTPEPSATLHKDGLLRAVSLLSGKTDKGVGAGRKLDGQVLTRRRTDMDKRRLLFQSLAVSIGSSAVCTGEIQGIEDRKEARTEAILDVMACLQPRISVSAAPLSRQNFLPTASRLAEQSPDPRVWRIPRQDIYILLLLLAILRFRGSLYEVTADDFRSTYLNQAAQHMLQSFIRGEDQDVQWETFGTVVEHVMVTTPSCPKATVTNSVFKPYLFNPLAELMHTLVTSENHALSPTTTDTTLHGLVYTHLPQLLAFLPKYVHKRLCQQPLNVFSLLASPLESRNNLLTTLRDQLRGQSGPLLFLIAAVPLGEEPIWKCDTALNDGDVTEEPAATQGTPSSFPLNMVLYGAFVATSFFPAANVAPAELTRLLNRSQLFQLAPLQDVFHAGPTAEGSSREWYHNIDKGESGGLSFGVPLGLEAPCKVALHVDENLEFGAFEHRFDGEGIYNSSEALGERRGTEKIEFKVWSMEVWSLGEGSGPMRPAE
ncbi:MAG: hypothetical protein Q9181_004341 [Wetmoreana brouardii]